MRRFRDQAKRLSDFYNEVWVVCKACSNKAIATTDVANKTATLICASCGHNKQVSMQEGKTTIIMAAHGYFNAALWLAVPYRNDTFWAYNGQHLAYLEQYIGASLREHQRRTGFTLLEKLPEFYHAAKNRSSLLKLIAKLKLKV